LVGTLAEGRRESPSSVCPNHRWMTS
jgi:hypothetical protein